MKLLSSDSHSLLKDIEWMTKNFFLSHSTWETFLRKAKHHLDLIIVMALVDNNEITSNAIFRYKKNLDSFFGKSSHFIWNYFMNIIYFNGTSKKKTLWYKQLSNENKLNVREHGHTQQANTQPVPLPRSFIHSLISSLFSKKKEKNALPADWLTGLSLASSVMYCMDISTYPDRK